MKYTREETIFFRIKIKTQRNSPNKLFYTFYHHQTNYDFFDIYNKTTNPEIEQKILQQTNEKKN